MRAACLALLPLIHASCCGASAAFSDNVCPNGSRRKAILGSLGVLGAVLPAVLSPPPAEAVAALAPVSEGEVLRWSDAFLFIDRSRWRCELYPTSKWQPSAS